MTGRALALLAAGAALVALGLQVNWPEVTALGAAALVLVALVVPAAGSRPRGEVRLGTTALRVTRGDEVSLRLSVTVPRRRLWLQVVEGPVRAPSSTNALPSSPRRGELVTPVPLDTSVRGVRPVGPYTLLQADPWGLVRREVAAASGGTLTVLPRVHPVRRQLTATRATGDSENASRRAGDQHFHALRDYVLGDEPRSVHWRSTARAGRLVVRQQVAAASIGTVVVLDTDQSAYPREGSFSSGWDRDRFELAVEVAASMTTSRLGSVEQVELMLSTRGAAPVVARAGATAHALDVLAAVQAVPPVETAPEELVAAVRRSRCAHLVVVTGSPTVRSTLVLQSLGRLVPSTVVLRAGGSPGGGVPGVHVVDVTSPEDLL